MTEIAIHAGRCDWDGKLVTPDKRKGTLKLVKGADGLTHMNWESREENGKVEEDLIVINDAYLERIASVTDGRVYVLRFTSSDKKLLFWLQTAEENADELVEQFNQLAGGSPPSPEAAQASVADDSPPAPSTAEGGAADKLGQLLGNFANTWQRQAGSQQHVDLQSLLAEGVVANLEKDEEASKDLAEFTPPSDSNVGELLRCPQFRSSVRHLAQAVGTDQLPVILASMGLELDASRPTTDPIEALVYALDKKYGPEPVEEKPAQDQAPMED